MHPILKKILNWSLVIKDHNVNRTFDKYAYCQSNYVPKWHIRKHNNKLYLSGGIDTNSLCGFVKQGWDLDYTISSIYDKYICKDCLNKYKEITYEDLMKDLKE